MDAFSQESANQYHVRSISLPCRSHPTTLRVEEKLTKLQILETSSSGNAETISSAVAGLGELYKCTEELLNLPETQQALAQHQPEKWVKRLLEGSVAYIDVCSNTRDAVVVIKEAVHDLQSALRRKKAGDLSIENDLNSYILSKKMRKQIAKSLATLKHSDSKFGDFPILESDHHPSASLRVLRKAREITVSNLQSLLLFLSVPVIKPKLTKWTLVSKLMHKGVVACEGQKNNQNELENVDIALSNLMVRGSCKDSAEQRIQSAQSKLAALDSSIEGLENGLELLLRRLICVRVSLLNILSW